jgi:hypothetical protein
MLLLGQLGLNGLIGIWKKECWWNLGCLLLCHLTTLQCKVQFLFLAFLCHLIGVPGPRAFYEAIWPTWTFNSSLLETNPKGIQVTIPCCNIADLLIKTSQNRWATANMQLMHQGTSGGWWVHSGFLLQFEEAPNMSFKWKEKRKDKSMTNPLINRNGIRIQMLHFCYQENYIWLPCDKLPHYYPVVDVQNMSSPSQLVIRLKSGSWKPALPLIMRHLSITTGIHAIGND